MLLQKLVLVLKRFFSLQVKRTAIIALGNIGDKSDLDFLVRCKELCDRILEKYILWSIEQIKRRMKK